MKFINSVVRKPITLLSVIVLIVLYFSMFFCEFVAPYDSTKTYEDFSYHPPAHLCLYSEQLGVGLQVQKQVVINEITYQYVRVEGEYVPIYFFVKGDSYRLFGLIPMKRHLFGTPADSGYPLYLYGSDNLGRDLFSRIIEGSRVSLTIGFIGMFISMSLAIIMGGFAGYYGGAIDWIIMRISEFFILIPGLYLILFLRSVLSRDMDSAQSYMVITVILSFVGWPGSARMIRGMIHSIKREDFVINARLEGSPSLVIIFKDIIPQMSSIIIVSVALGIPGFILGETALSYLGLGIVDPAVSWGSLIKKDVTTLTNLRNFPWFLIPGLYLLLTTLAFNFIGDHLRDYMDPYYIIRKRKINKVKSWGRKKGLAGC